jgi:serine/threonine protein kinase
LDIAEALMSKADETLGWSTLPLGTVLREKYRIDRVLGVGGTAVVYAVTHRNRRRFALKLLHPDLSRRPDVRARFTREGYVANTVEHPSIVEVLDDDVDDHGSAFLVMELLEGVSVDALSATIATSSPRAALELAEQLLDALDHAHQKSIIHRDIKPSNLFVTRAGTLKVLDFGVARLRDRAAPTTQTGATLGTPAFMAPEQARSQNGALDARVDIWAVGATLFTLLSGKHVHEGEGARDVLIRCATEPPRTLASVMPDARRELVELVDRALRVDPDERFESATAMRDAVREVMRRVFPEPHGALQAVVSEHLARSTEPALAPSPSPIEHFTNLPPVSTQKGPRRAARGVTLAAALVLGVAGTFGIRALVFEARSAGSIALPAPAAPAAAPKPANPSEPVKTAPPPPARGAVLPVNARTAAAAPHAAPRTKPTAVPASPPDPPSAGARENPLHLEIQ